MITRLMKKIRKMFSRRSKKATVKSKKKMVMTKTPSKFPKK